MKTIPHYCQKCGVLNELGERDCHNCGTRLMLVIFPPSARHDESVIPSFYEDHLLERVSLLELRLSQVAERLTTALDLVVNQVKSAHSDHILLKTLIETLDELGAIQKDELNEKWRNKAGLKAKPAEAETESRHEILLRKILGNPDNPKKDLFINLVREGFGLIIRDETKQGLRLLERALIFSPKNSDLLFFAAETYFRAEQFEKADDYLKKLLKIVPKHQKGNLLAAFIYTDLQEISKAKKHLQKLKENYEAAFFYNYLQAMIAVSERDFESVLDFFKDALKEFDSPEMQYLTGCAFFEAGKNKHALRHFQKAVENDTNYADAWFMIGKTYESLGEQTKVYQAFELAWSSRETGAQCLEFLQNKNKGNIDCALPFVNFVKNRKFPLTRNAARLSRFIIGKIFQFIESDE